MVEIGRVSCNLLKQKIGESNIIDLTPSLGKKILTERRLQLRIWARVSFLIQLKEGIMSEVSLLINYRGVTAIQP